MASDKKTILLVEDEKLIMLSYSEILQDAGFNTITAENGTVGLQLAEQNKGKIDLMLLDLMMPKVDGLMMMDALKANKEKYGADFPIVVLTNMSSESVIKEALDRGAVSYLIKMEIAPEVLINEVKKQIEKAENEKKVNLT